MKYYLIAGEASGDLHASNLMKGLKKFDKKAEFRFFGGEKMEDVGGQLVRHYKSMAYMGVVDVLLHIRTIGKNLKFCKSDILEYQPDVVILVDYAGFNLRIAEYAKSIGLKVYYYISPKVWVWKKSRIEKLREFTDKLFVILPFEVSFFEKNKLEAEYFGNPLMDSIHDFKSGNPDKKNFLEAHMLNKKPVVALLSGSRKDEIKRCLPEMLKVAKAYPEYNFVIAGAPSASKGLYEKIIKKTQVKIVYNQTYELLNVAYAALVTSGTATLETAIFNVPQVVVYKTSPFNYHIGILFIKIRFFSLVNLIAGKEVVKELLQYQVRKKLRTEFERLLQESERKKMKEEYLQLRKLLGEPGGSERVAARITESLNIS